MRRIVVAVIGLLVLAVPAAADQRINATTGKRYSNPSVTIAQGEKVTFHNGDVLIHDVTANQDRDGKPLFSSPLTDAGGDSVVDGTQYLKTGEYTFYCSVHPDMQGKITVSSAGTPVPRPGSGPTLSAASTTLARLRSSGKLVVKVAGASGSTASVTAKAKLHGKSVTLAKGSAKLASDAAQRITLKIGAAARKALKGVKSLAVTFKVAVGSQSASAKRTYR